MKQIALVIMVLALAVGFTACAKTSAAKAPNSSVAVTATPPPQQAPETKPDPVEKKMVVDVPQLEGWVIVASQGPMMVIFHPETKSYIQLRLFPTGHPGFAIKHVHEDGKAKKIPVSDIGYSADKKTAWFTYEMKPEIKGENVDAGKILFTVIPNLPSMSVMVIGNWKLSNQEKIMMDFDKLWMGIKAIEAK